MKEGVTDTDAIAIPLEPPTRSAFGRLPSTAKNNNCALRVMGIPLPMESRSMISAVQRVAYDRIIFQRLE